MNTCEENLWFCNAECCRQFALKINLDFDMKRKDISFVLPDNKDLVHYLKLHGVLVEGGVGVVQLRNYYVDAVNNRLMFMHKCKALDKSNHCVLHGLSSQPKLCGTPNSKGDALCTGCSVTPRCAFKELYKTNEGEKK